MEYKLYTIDEFSRMLMMSPVKRYIGYIQNHHTAIPSYHNFNNNHQDLLKGMHDYHVNVRGFQDISQNLTTFPDGLIAVCRPLEIEPAGIKGINKNALCIEHVGNFDPNGDIMTAAHRETIVKLNAVLCKKFNLVPSTDSIIYHHWFDLDTGKRTGGTGNVKSCPGRLFFGGNSVECCRENFIPLIKAAM